MGFDGGGGFVVFFVTQSCKQLNGQGDFVFSKTDSDWLVGHCL